MAYNQEVTLRLKFEHKINEVNSIHRELIVKHERLLKDNESNLKKIKDLEKDIIDKTGQIVNLKERNLQLKEDNKRNLSEIENLQKFQKFFREKKVDYES